MRTRCAAIGRTWTDAPGRDARRISGEPARRGSGTPGGATAAPRRSRRRVRRHRARTSRRCAGFGPRDHPWLASRRLPRRSSAVSLPFQFLPLVIAVSGKSREAREVRARAGARSRPRLDRRDAGVQAEPRAMTPRVAITGIGLVTALGATREESWRRMLAGECGIRPATVFDTDGYRSRIAAEVDIDAVDARLDAARAAPLSRGDRIGVHAATEALADSGLARRRRSIARASACFWARARPICCATKQFYRTLDHERDSIAPVRRTSWNHFLSTPVDAIAARFGFEGPRACIVAACSSSTIAIGRAAEAIRSGRADAALAGGTDALRG